MDYLNYIGPGLAIGLSGLWVAIGQWILGRRAMEVMGKKSEMTNFFLTITILWMALVESAVIYWFIVAFQILGNADMPLLASIGTGLAIWLAWMWAWIWEGKLIGWALKAIDKNPEIKARIMTFMVLFIALVESAAIYGLVVAFQILGADNLSMAAFVWMWVSIGFAGLWVSIWEWIIAEKSMEVMGNRPNMMSFFLTVTILGIALVESAAIYGLVVAFDVLGKWLELYAALGAGAAIWLAWLGAWVWEWQLIAGALSAMERNPDIKAKIMTFMVLFVALIEVTAIYGFIVAFNISGSFEVDSMVYLGAGLAIGIAGLWVAIGRWYLGQESLEIMGKNPKMISFLLTVSILWVALVESAAIYALIVSFQILSIEALSIYAAMWAGLAIWLTWLGAWVWEGLLIKGAIRGMNIAPENKWKILAFMVLFVALIEVVAIYGLIIAFRVLG